MDKFKAFEAQLLEIFKEINQKLQNATQGIFMKSLHPQET
jgi:hypothetical protein